MGPVIVWRNEPMLPHVVRQGTDDHSNGRAWVEREASVYKIEPLHNQWRAPRRYRRRARARGRSSCSITMTIVPRAGTMDTTVVLAEILKQGLEDVTASAIYDPAAGHGQDDL